MARLPLLLVALAALLAVPALAEEPCEACAGRAVVPCAEHPKVSVPPPPELLFCSGCAECATCAGTSWVLCAECEDPAGKGALARRAALLAEARPGLAALDAEVGRALPKVETLHYRLVFELEELKVGRERLDRHELLHLYAARLEQLFTDYREALGAPETDFADKAWVFVWALLPDHLDGGMRFVEMQAPQGVKLMGDRSRYSVCGNRQFFAGDEPLHRNLVHHVTHLWISHQRPTAWIGQKKAGWADAGLAHWFEDRYFGVCDNYCFQEQDTRVDFHGGKYKVAVRKLVGRDEEPAPGAVLARTTQELTPAEHAVSFSYVDYLLQRDSAAFAKVLALLKEGVAGRDALGEAFGLNPLELHAAWREWVLATYPTR